MVINNNIGSNGLIEGKEPILLFDNSSKERILSSLGITKNVDSELVNDSGKVLTNADLEPVQFEEFGGILRSSKVLIKKDKADLIRYFVSRG